MSNNFKKGNYTTFSNKIGLYQKDNGFVAHNTDVVLSFPFKDTVLEAGMAKEDAGREERFLHLKVDGRDIDVLFEPKVLTNYQYVTRNTGNTTQHNTTQHNTTQHNTTQHNTTQHNTTQHNTTQHYRLTF